MSIVEALKGRAGDVCELCSGGSNFKVYTMPPAAEEDIDKSLLVCEVCLGQIENPDSVDVNHWRCLSGSMWSEHESVQIMSWRMLKKLSSEGWAQDLIDQIYLSEEALEFARVLEENEASGIVIKDSNGAVLKDGDSVTLIKDLVVKGANFTAKRGTLVKNISLTSNHLHIEGKVNGTQIVLVSAYLKKVNE